MTGEAQEHTHGEREASSPPGPLNTYLTAGRSPCLQITEEIVARTWRFAGDPATLADAGAGMLPAVGRVVR